MTDDAMRQVFEMMENRLGVERMRSFHSHFSKIQYTTGGEKCHLTFDDREFGPDPDPLTLLLRERGLTPRIICESAGTQTEDAAAMKALYCR